MAEPYFDPANALPSPSTYEMGGFPSALSYQSAADRRETNAPFIGMAAQSSQADLSKKLTELQEFQSPTAVQQRELQRKADIEKYRTAVENEPLTRKLQALTTRKDIDLMPLQSDFEKKQFANKILEEGAKPQNMFMAHMASVYPDIANAKDPFTRKSIYDSAVKQFEAKYGSLDKLGLEHLRGYSEDPNFQNGLRAMHSAMVYTAQHQQELEKTGMEVAGRKEVAGIQAGSAQAVARIQETGATARAGMQIEAGKTPEQRYSKIVSSLADPKLDSGKRASLEAEKSALVPALVNNQLDAEFGKLDPTMAATLGADKISNYFAQRQNRKVQLFIQRGEPVPMNDLRAISPGKSDEEIKSQAKKKGIKVTD